MWYTVRDNITGEIIDFSNRIEAEFEADRRLNRHRSGYNLRRTCVDPVDAVLIKNKRTFIITVRPDYEENN